MDNKDLRRMARSVTKGEVAGRSTDPAFYSSLRVLPNPDSILRQMGRAEDAYDAIMSDAHVIGEVRSMRAGLLSYKPRVVAAEKADESPKQKLALELCQGLLLQSAAPGMLWMDVIWNMGTAVLRGFRVHEVVWEYIDGYLLPQAILDRANRRFKFSPENDLRLLTKTHPVYGEETEPYKWLVTRHMPSIDNPYGQALLSSCFWPYTFKHGGFKFLYQFCERYGLPWPLGKYPPGTPEKEQMQLLDALLDMLESGAGAIPEGDSVELLTTNHSGELVQESLVHLCNREMSKALTSQTLATEMRNVGSNAAAKTHSDREQGVHESDRIIIEATFNRLFADITRFNCGDDVLPPKFELFKPKQVTKDRAAVWETAARIGNPSLKAFHKEMNIPEAEDDDDRLTVPGGQNTDVNFSSSQSAREFAQNITQPMEAEAVSQADQVIEQELLKPVYQMLQDYERNGKTLQEFLNDLPQLFSSLDSDGLAELNSQVIQLALAEGMADA